MLIILTVEYAVLLQPYALGRSLFVVFFLATTTALYLGWRERKNWKKLLWGSLVFGCVFGFALSFFAEATGAWTTNDYIFHFRFFGLNTIEEVLGHGLMAFYTFLFYEHFLDDEKRKRLNPRYLWGLVIGIIGSLVLVAHYMLVGSVYLPYAYLWPATVALVPLIVMVVRHPSLLSKLAILSLFSFFLWFLMECLAVSFNYWSYQESIWDG